MTAGLETFAKVRALHDRTDNAGERAAAASRMEKLARKAGMSVPEALSKLDTSAPKSQAQAAADAFNDFFNTPEMRAQRAERERKRQARCVEIQAEYGSEEAVFAPTPWEIALERACDRFVVRQTTTGWRIGSLWGWDLFSIGKPAPEIVEAVSSAYPMPRSVQEAWAEFIAWDKLGRDRETYGSGAGDPYPWVRVRTDLMEGLLDTMPAHSLNDLRARMDWMDWRNALEIAPDPKEEAVRLAALRADIERMGARLREEAASVQNGHTATPIKSGQRDYTSKRDAVADVQNGQPEGIVEIAIPLRRTNAEKRRDVLALLNAENAGIGPLTDREIARRAGVSPTTVGTIRRARSNHNPAA